MEFGADDMPDHADEPRLPLLPADQALTADIANALADLKEA